MSAQLALPLETRPALGRGDFIVAAPNEAAVRFIDRWPDWPAPAAALHGPEGSGKTHLVEVWCKMSGARTIPAAELDAEAVGNLAAGMPIAIEDVDRARASPERDHALMGLFERAAAGRSALLLTAHEPPQNWPSLFPDLASRFQALVAFPLWSPDEALLAALARKLFADRQLTVSNGAIARMLRTLERAPAAIRDFVAAADRKALAERRKVGERLIVELLDDRDKTMS